MPQALPPSNRDEDIGVLCPAVLSSTQIKRILSLTETMPKVDGRIQSDGQIVQNKEYRDTEIFVIDESEFWLDDLILSIIAQANLTYQFEISGLIERPQILHYPENSIGYDWHMDIGTGDHSTRKISLSCMLNDDYEGGELSFFLNGEASLSPSIGQCISFPAFMPHRVKKVTKGSRLALVAWISGTPFR